MSFQFNEQMFKDNSFNDTIKQRLTSALNSFSKKNNLSHESSSSNTPSSSSSNTSSSSSASIPISHETNSLSILKSGIVVRKVNFPTIPQIEILDLDIQTTQPRSLLKGMCKISCKDATLQIQTTVSYTHLDVYKRQEKDLQWVEESCFYYYLYGAG